MSEAAMWGCPDGGYCHHDCERACFRVLHCGPLSDVFRDDEWPARLLALHRSAAPAGDA